MAKHGGSQMFSRLAWKASLSSRTRALSGGTRWGLPRGFPRHGVPARVGKALQPLPAPRAALESDPVQGGMEQALSLLRVEARGPRSNPAAKLPTFRLSKANAVCACPRGMLKAGHGGGTSPPHPRPREQPLPAPPAPPETPHPGSGTTSGQRLGMARPQCRQGAALV